MCEKSPSGASGDGIQELLGDEYEDKKVSPNQTIKMVDKLDMELLLNYLKSCINKDGTINLVFYTKAYRELNRFFELLGAVFHFVAKDVHSKIVILEKYQKSESSDSFQTVQSMINYEKENDLLTCTTNPSGSRTLLRLHRALEFIIDFLRRVCAAANDDNVSSHAQEAYSTTLAKFHPWIIRKAANFAMYALPVKGRLMEQTCQQENDNLSELALQVVQIAGNIYMMVQTIYEENNLLDLP